MPIKRVLISDVASDAGAVAAKSLVAAGFEVVTANLRRPPPGLHSRYSTLDYLVSGPNRPEFEKNLLNLVQRIRPDVFLPLSTKFAFAASRNLDRLLALTALNNPDVNAFLAAYRKSLCMAECRKLGIPCPLGYSHDEALRMLQYGHGETVVVKPDFDAGAAKGVRFVTDPQSLCEAEADCVGRFGPPLIQQYIPGGPEAMKTIVLLFSVESRLTAAFTTRKIRQWPATGGQTVVSISTAEQFLVSQILPFFEKWRWRGPAEVELKFDSRDGRHKVIEINPRFPFYLRLPCQCGLDLPALAVRLAQNIEAISPFGFPAYRVGAKYLSPGLFFRTVAADLRASPKKTFELRRAIRDLQGTIPLVFGMFDDPLPLLARALGIV